MCSLGDDELEVESFITHTNEQEKGIDLKSCRRCESNATVILRAIDAYCTPCFLSAASHKFRSVLGKSKKMKPSDKVLAAYSRGQSSATLLHMLWSGKQVDDHKKLLYEIIICYIDDGGALGLSLEKRKEILTSIEAELKVYGFPVYFTTLNRFFLSDEKLFVTASDLNSDDDIQLLQLFGKTASLTSKEDLLLKMRENLLVRVARQLGCNKIFTGDCQTALAVKVLSSIALGRGEQLPLEVGFIDHRHSDVWILRPLKDLEAKEIAFYNKFNNLSCRPKLSLTTGKPSSCSIRKLTEAFVVNLHKDAPATVPAIYRTGEKLNTSAGSQIEDEQCLLCKGPMAKAVEATSHRGAYSSLDATEFSRIVSLPSASCEPNQNGTSECGNSEGCCGRGCEEKLTVQNVDAFQKEAFCYGCLLIIRDLESIELLPSHIWAEAKKRHLRNAMRDEISEFLL